jgi:hypothetical protein
VREGQLLQCATSAAHKLFARAVERFRQEMENKA